ncbi:hypothetical protein TNCV_4382921 [Trichonephila clavipes]|nr:hypothetical protein TNCV_4382921 [Trichonephila clavipes]
MSVPEPYEIGSVIEEVVDLARQINLEMNSDNIQELLDSRNHRLTIDELIEMHEQEYDIENEFLNPSIRRSNAVEIRWWATQYDVKWYGKHLVRMVVMNRIASFLASSLGYVYRPPSPSLLTSPAP